MFQKLCKYLAAYVFAPSGTKASASKSKWVWNPSGQHPDVTVTAALKGRAQRSLKPYSEIFSEKHLCDISLKENNMSDSNMAAWMSHSLDVQSTLYFDHISAHVKVLNELSKVFISVLIKPKKHFFPLTK